MRRLIAWDSAAGANVINDRRYFITSKPFSMQINGISDVPVHASAIGMTPFGKALLVEGMPISLISQTAMHDQGFDFFLENDSYILPTQHAITDRIEFTRTLEKRLYTVNGDIMADMANTMRMQAEVMTSNQIYEGTTAFAATINPNVQTRLEAARLHNASGHMSDKYLITLLERGLICGTTSDISSLKSALILNSKECKCAACFLGKAVGNNPHTHQMAETTPGMRIYADVMHSTVCLGTKLLHHLSRDCATGFIDVHEMIFNNASQLAHVHRKLKLQWALRGYQNVSLQYDACKIVESMKTDIVEVGIEQDQPGQHQVTIENTIRTFRDHHRAITASLHFIPDEIQSKYLILWVAQTMNNSYNRVLDACPMQKINPAWKLNAQTDMTVAYGDLIMANVMKDQTSLSKGKPAKHPCIVVAAKMNGSGTITVYSLLTQNYYQTSGLQSAIKYIQWTDDLERVAHYIIWNNIKVRHTDSNELLKSIPPESVMMPDYFNNIPETILKDRTMKMLAKMEKHATKPDIDFEQALDQLRTTAIPEIIAAIDQHKASIRGEPHNPNQGSGLGQKPLPIATVAHTHAPPTVHQTLPPIATDAHTHAPPTVHQTLPPIAADVHTNAPSTELLTPSPSTIDTDLPMPVPTSILKTPGKAHANQSIQPKQVTIDPAYQHNRRGTIRARFDHKTHTWITPTDDSTTLAMAAQPSTDELNHRILHAVDIHTKFNALAAIITVVDKTANDQEAILQSRLKEMKVLIDKGTIHPIKHTDMTVMEMQKRLLTKIFTIRKRDGAYKSRMVTGASDKPQDKADVPNSWAPTGKFEFVLMGLCIALRESRHISTIDFTAAFLNADLPKQVTPQNEEFRRILEVKPEMIDLIIKVKPEWKEFICQGRGKHGSASRGSMFFVIDKALYGMIEASFAWHSELHTTLLAMGFEQSESDPCVYHSYKNGDRTSIIVYVDDLMVLAKSKLRAQAIQDELRKRYNSITTREFNAENEIDYLNVHIKQVKENEKTVAYEVHQTAYCKKIIEDLQLEDEMSPFEKTILPYTLDLFHVSEDSPLLNKEDTKWYAMAVGKLLYTSSKVRTLLALPVSFLSKRMKAPTHEDKDKLMRVLFWIRQHPIGGLTIRDSPDEDLKIKVWADASDNSHYDGKGHTGIFISIGDDIGSPIYYASKVQSLVSRSSTEAELIAVYQSIPNALWAMEAITEWGYTQEQFTLFQDNISTIIASHDGNKPFSKLSHVNRRFFNAREYIQLGIIHMPHCDTRSMLADPLTKPMTPGLSTPHIRKMFGLDNIENKTCTPNKDEEEVFDALTAYFLNFSLEDDFEDEV